MGTHGASGKPTEKQGVTTRHEDGTTVTTVMSSLSATACEQAESTDASRQSDSMLERPSMPYIALTTSPATFFELLRRHRYVILTDLPVVTTEACSQAAAACAKFFEEEKSSDKQACSVRDTKLNCGFRGNQTHREHYHMRAEAGERQPWPSPAFSLAASRASAALEAVGRLCLNAALQGAQLPPVQNPELGCSVFDAFWYHPSGCDSIGDEAIVLQGHNDPGYFTIEPKASAPGLQILDGDGKWVLVEPLLGAQDLVVFGCEELRYATMGKLSSTWHRVSARPDSSRLALAFELRDVSTGASFLQCRTD